ncbi:MAG: hypothetical protein V4675_08150 [Verrucomicrobiota bacterium]
MLAFAALWLARAPILRTAARLWIVDESLIPARAIVVLGGGEDYRPFAAARLWKQGLAPVILVPQVIASRTESLGLRPTTTQIILGVLKSEGIPDDAIQLYGKDLSSTREEALAVQTWLTSAPPSTLDPRQSTPDSPTPAVDQAPTEFPGPPTPQPPASPPRPSTLDPHLPNVLLIPTDPFATRRTNAFFGKTLPGCDVRVLRTDPQDLSVDTWWSQEQGLIDFQNEVIKWLFYKIKY